MVKQTAKKRLLQLLQSGGHAIYESGWRGRVFGSDGIVYGVRTARELSRAGLCELRWGQHKGREWSWAYVSK